MLRVFKKIVFWSYGRSTWQYDVLCVLILAFVFLTPKDWFSDSELKYRLSHQNLSNGAEKLLLRPENLGRNPDREAVERGARFATGRADARVTGWHELRDESGRIAAYEVDIE